MLLRPVLFYFLMLRVLLPRLPCQLIRRLVMPDSTLSAVAGAIPLVGGIISSAINNSDTAANNDVNRSFAVQQQQQAEQFNQQMWQEQADYNAPAAQMARYAAAGLNPNMVYGSGSVSGNVAELPAPAPKIEYVSAPQRAPDLSSDLSSGLAAYANVAKVTPTVDNLNANSAKAVADAALAGAQKSSSEMDVPLKQEQIVNLNLDSILKNAQQLNLDQDTKSKSTMLAPDVANLNADSALKQVQAITGLKSIQLQTAMNAVSIKEAVANIAQIESMTAKNDAERRNILQSFKSIMQSQEMTDLDTQLKAKNVGLQTPGWFYTLLQVLQGTGLNGAMQGVMAGAGKALVTP
ncbi:DNA pilot protein VP2 [Microviridae Bog9017_22]|uniref:DNA pilot protein VP2 n=1 Tax=Microviridae Bog9017_22 TaxID=1655651 RepID=UPI00063D5944|nr:DNA pilot protein VP2 [Microviridae Bog9017_22]AKI26897.1 DNA pilot protein VP2 [Microviridae Bog9017_22]